MSPELISFFSSLFPVFSMGIGIFVGFNVLRMIANSFRRLIVDDDYSVSSASTVPSHQPTKEPERVEPAQAQAPVKTEPNISQDARRCGCGTRINVALSNCPNCGRPW
jgi:hypothetical protein